MDRREFLAAAGAAALEQALSTRGASASVSSSDCITAAYYFGNFHVDERNERAHGPGWTEWNLVRAARPRFDGHQQPKVPEWGYADESDPRVFEKKIAAGHKAGLDALIFDWYWYDDGPFLNAALDRGFLGAANRADMKFALMWANHDWYDIHPAKLTAPPHLQYPGAVTRETFHRMGDRLLELFQHPSYLKLEGAPYFSIYELYRFVQGMGGVDAAASALDELRSRARSAGLPGVHINAVTWGVQLLPGQSDAGDLPQMLKRLRIDSTTSYVWIHHTRWPGGMTAEYREIRRQYEVYREGAAHQFGLPYFPNVTVGWDASPRTCVTDEFRLGEYPYTPVIVNNTPQAFAEAIASAKRFALTALPPGKRLITINSWNEWTEGSYLEPDQFHGNAYLDALHRALST